MPAPQSESNAQRRSAKTPSPETVEQTEQDPAVERGERIHTGKEIARSGKELGEVPGAEETETEETEKQSNGH